ncbi:filamentous hemagglutinin [Pseudomonas sp. SDI]|uniref:hemagglutinin repeat-containing protein n=1 Tax=Pseudomonas sp. SDI TaxID=2170734 RepID=UPI000DE6AB1B|nr:hemagglutinin repeat-containing protein [Pseudomonas sp. SDI]PWB35643.1 filamentous hemagglutinin [Pseudomonas sp. SDI]
MPMNSRFTFNLCPSGKLRWAIASLLLAAHLPNALAGGVVVAPGPGGTAQLQTQGGVPIVNIVAPNGAGLSHNQFLDYNVDRQGLVLNNALQAGQSQLAGQLAANPQFQGQAASVILNEVVSRNASAINGAQEVFGRAADYVLANPNGISVNGGSFINTPNASLVVGRPELNDGKLQALSSREASGTLQVQAGGLRNGEGSVNLIAPRIDAQGGLVARDQLNITAGRNQVNSASGQVTAVDPASHSNEQRIDASLFGAMQAGRINIVSTAEGAGVRVGAGPIAGHDGVRIDSAGDLSVSAQATPNSLDLSRAGIRSSQGDVSLRSGRDLNLAATDVAARDVRLEAKRNLTLGSVESRKLQEQRDSWYNSTIGITWETYERTRSDSQTRQHGTQVLASRDAQLTSGNHSELRAAKLDAGNTLSVHSGGDLRLTAASEVEVHSDQGKHRKHLWNADWDNRSEEQRSVNTQLKGRDIDLRSAASLHSEGAQLTSDNDIQVASKQLEITRAVNTRNSSNHASDSTFFGVVKHESRQRAKDSSTVRSELSSDSKLTLKSAGDFTVTGATLNAGGALVIDAGGEVNVSAAQDQRERSSSSANRGFELYAKENAVGAGQYRAGLNYRNQQKHETETTVSQQGASLSGASVQVRAAGDLTLKGAQVESSAGDTRLSGKNLALLAEHDSHSNSVEQSHTGAGLYLAGGLDRAGAGIDFAHGSSQDANSKTTAITTGVTSSGNLNIKAGALSSEGAQVRAGNALALNAETLDNHAASNTTSTNHRESNWSADLGVNAEYKDIARPVVAAVKEVLDGKVPNKDALGNLGQPNLGVDLAVGHASAGHDEQGSNALVSQFQGGTVEVEVGGTLRDQGTQYNANAGKVTISAGQLQADAASNRSSRSEQAVDAKVDVRVYTKTGEDLNVAGSGAGGSSYSSKDSSTAVVGGYAGSQGVKVEVRGAARFEGSRFDGGQGGVVVETGGELVLNQADDRQHSDSASLRGSASLSVGTLPGVNGSNVDVGAGLQLDHASKQVADRQARVAEVLAAGPVQLSSAGAQVQQGSKVGSASAVELRAGGALDLQAATSSHSANGGNLGGGLNVGGSKVSGETSLDKSGKLSGNFSVGRISEDTQTLSAGQLDSQGRVALGGESVHLQGAQVAAVGVSVDAGKGGIRQTSAQSSEQRGNWSVGLNAGGNLSSTAPTSAEKRPGSDYAFNAGATVGVDYLQGTRQQHSEVKAGQVQVNNAGELLVERRKDAQDQFKLDVDLGLTGKRLAPDEKRPVAGTDYTPTLTAQAEYAHAEHVQAGAGLNGAGATEATSLDYGVKAGLQLPHKADDKAPQVSLEDGQLKVGPVTLSAHFDSKKG